MGAWICIPNRDASSHSTFYIYTRHLRNQWPWISLRGHSRSYILSAIESTCTILYRPRPLMVTFALSLIVSGILLVLYALGQFFSIPHSFPAELWECFLRSRSAMMGPAKRGKVTLISREIIFQESQPIWSRNLNVGRTDGQHATAIRTALCV